VLSGPALALRLRRGSSGQPDAANRRHDKAEITISGIGELSQTPGNVDLKLSPRRGSSCRQEHPWTIGYRLRARSGTLKIEFQDRLEQFRVSLTGAILEAAAEFAAAGDRPSSASRRAIDKTASRPGSAELHPRGRASGASPGRGA